MSESAVPSIGAMIVAAREAAELSLADVSERTRIRKGVIEAIEHDDFSHCGGDVYAKGHLRSIATAVSADGRVWVAAYDQQYGTPAPTATEVFDSEASRPIRLKRGVNWSAIMAAALVIAVGLVVVQMTTTSDEPSREQTTVAEPEATPTETAPTDEPTDDTKVAQADPEEVFVRITALPGQQSWMLVTASDGGALFEGMLSDGQSKTFRDPDKLSVLSGCASAVELTVNGQNAGSPGGECAPVTSRFTPKDPDGAAG
jgi:cytoskeletal protein RodZ